jgi:hypothetical protein
MSRTEKARIAAEQIDQLVTLMLHLGWAHGKGLITRFYEAARQKHDKPLSLLAAQGLMDRVERADTVVITTGVRLSPTYLMLGETDGAPGAAVIARALNLAIKALPVIAVEEAQVSAASAVLRAAGFTVTTLEKAKRFAEEGDLRNMVAGVTSFPAEENAARKRADQILTELEPKAIIAIEQLGMNDMGVYHSFLGHDVSEGQARVDHLFNRARDCGIFTIGIGDAGNEIGYGVIKDVVREYTTYGAKCRCPCGSGAAVATETDVLFPASVSNWGAYGVAAMLLMMAGKWQLIHNGSMETRLLNAAAEAGLIHMGSEVAAAVDTFPLMANIAVVELIREIVRKTELFDIAAWSEGEGFHDMVQC